MANSEDPDQTPRSAASDLDLHCLFRPVCLNNTGKYGSFTLHIHHKSVVMDIPV